MALMVSPPPRDSREFTVPLEFSLTLRCVECKTVTEKVVELYDEPDDAADAHDFYASGVLKTVEDDCPRCGHKHWLILSVRPNRRAA